MLFQGCVPNTYAAGIASRATWREREKPTAEDQEINAEDALMCECGRLRHRAKSACTRCTALDAKQDLGAIDAEVLDVLEVGEAVLVAVIAERLAFKYDRSAIYRALQRQLDAGRVTKRRGKLRIDGHIYTRVD